MCKQEKTCTFSTYRKKYLFSLDNLNQIVYIYLSLRLKQKPEMKMTKSAEIKQELKKYNDANYSIRIQNQKWGQIVTVKTDLIIPENCADDSAANRRHEKEVKSIIDNMYYKLGMGGRIYIYVLQM